MHRPIIVMSIVLFRVGDLAYLGIAFLSGTSYIQGSIAKTGVPIYLKMTVLQTRMHRSRVGRTERDPWIRLRRLFQLDGLNFADEADRIVNPKTHCAGVGLLKRKDAGLILRIGNTFV